MSDKPYTVLTELPPMDLPEGFVFIRGPSYGVDWYADGTVVHKWRAGDPEYRATTPDSAVPETSESPGGGT